MIGRSLGHYVVVDQLGAGGMGEVYRARDTRLERDVALKVLAGSPTSDRAGARLRREALALSRLNHPSIAAVYDFDVQDGLAFVVMELVPGGDLRERLKAGPVPEAELLALGCQAAEALQAAHRAGIVHRDLKPGNLRLSPDGRLKVLDFGIAASAPEGADRGVTHTATMRVVGTVPYMAPEQLRGEPPDPRSDLYALCAVLYEMAVGGRPFTATVDAMLVDQILNHPAALARSRNPGVSAGLEALLDKGLAKDAARRYQTASDLLVDLERLRTPPVTHQAVVHDRPARRSTRWWRAAAAAAVLALAAWAAWRSPSSQPALAFTARDWVLVADFDNQTGDPTFDAALAPALFVGLSQSAYANVLPKQRVDQALLRMGRRDAPRIDEAIGREIAVREGIRGVLVPGIARIGGQFTLTARLVDPRSGVTVRSHEARAASPDRVLDALGDIASRTRQDLGESLTAIGHDSRPLPQVTTPALEALTSYAEGRAQWDKGEYRAAVELYERAVQIDPDFAMAHAALGNAHTSFVLNNYQRGRQHYQRALALVDRVTERERLGLLAAYEARLGDRSRAVDRYRAFLARYPDDYAVRYNFAGVLRELERLPEAIAEYQEASRLAPGHAPTLVNLATAFAMAERLPEALEVYDRAFALEPAWKNGGNLNHEYGFVLVRAGRQDEARRVFDLTAPSSDERPRGLRSHALLDMYQGKYRAAEARLQEAVRLDGPLDRPLTQARDRLFLAIVQQALNRRQDAVATLRRVVTQLETLEGVSFLVRAGVMLARLGEMAMAQRVRTVLRSKAPETLADRSEIDRYDAELLLATGSTAQAVEALRGVISRPDRQRALAQESLAYALAAADRPDEAAAAYTDLLALNASGWEPQHAWFEAHVRLARIEHARGRGDEARTRLDALLALWRDGDGDLPLLVEARRLQGALSPR